jgi:hypothetical protein
MFAMFFDIGRHHFFAFGPAKGETRSEYRATFAPTSRRDDGTLSSVCYPAFMRFVLPLLLIASPAFADQRTDVSNHRTAPELSDIALFVMAVAGVWLVRRTLRKRFAKQVERETRD